MFINGTGMSMTRGDSESITLTLEENGKDSNFVDGDILYFTVKNSIFSEDILIQKVIRNFDDGKALIYIEPCDTSNLTFSKYIYDIQLVRVNGLVKTIIKPSIFEITGEVTYD